MNIFVSTPMNGRTDDQIKNTFKHIEASVRSQLNIDEKEIINVVNASFGTADRYSRVQMLGHSIAKLDTADAIIFTREFTQARGCLCEYSVVNNYGDDWVKDPNKPNVYFELPDGVLKETKNRLERHRCFMMDQMDNE